MPSTPKKKSTPSSTPSKSSSTTSSSTTSGRNPKKLPRKTSKPPTHADVEEGRQIYSRLPHDDIKTLLENLQMHCPPFEEKTAAARFGLIKWNEVAPPGLSPDEARKVWCFLRSCERTNRNMHEMILAAQHKNNLKSNPIRKKAILKAPDRPTPPSGLASAFSYYIQRQYNKMTPEDKGPNFNYMLWYRDQGIIYRSLSEEEKAKEVKIFEDDKATYEKSLMEYYEAIGMNPENNPTGLPGLKDTRPKAIRAPRAPPKSELFKDAPQLPLTPLKSFIKTKFDRIESPPEDEDEIKELEEKYTRKYNELSQSKKFKWIKYVLDELEEYFTNLEEYKETHPTYNPKPFKISNLLTNDELALWEAKQGKPQKSSTSPGDYFRRELVSEGLIDTDLPEDEIKAEADRQWKQLGSKDQKTYKLKHDLENMQYSKQLEEYYSSLPEYLRPILLPAIHKRMTKSSQDSKSTKKNKTLNGEHHDVNSPSAQKKSKKTKQVQQQQEVNSDEEEQEDEIQVEEEQVVVKKSKKKRKNVHEDDEEITEDANLITDEELTESPKKKKKKKHL